MLNSVVRFHVARVTVVFAALLFPSVLAQGAITGVVKDASGAVLPGVTVEAASPASSKRSGPSSATIPASIGSWI